MVTEEQRQKAIEWGIANPEARNNLRRRQRRKAKEDEDRYYEGIK